MSSPAAGAEDPSWPHRPGTGSVLAARRKTQASRCRPTGREALPCLIPTTSPPPFCSKKQGKTEAIFLYDFAQFTGQNEDAGLYRAKINGCWHCPDGKYTALSADAVAALVRDWLTGAPSPGPRPQGLDKPVRVFAHWDDDDGGGCGQAWTKTPPHLGADARWWIWIDGPRLVRCEDVRVLTREELRKSRGDDHGKES